MLSYDGLISRWTGKNILGMVSRYQLPAGDDVYVYTDWSAIYDMNKGWIDVYPGTQYGNKEPFKLKMINDLNILKAQIKPSQLEPGDELIQEQADVIKRRKLHTGKGPKERFSRPKSPEASLVRAGDPLIIDPYGPRIMWTSALVLETLLMLGSEKKKRVQTALRTLTINPHWCDNTYQYGLSSWKRTKPPTIKEIDKAEEFYIQMYQYGGIFSPSALLNPKTAEYFHRLSHLYTAEGEMYLLKMPTDIGEGCRIIMTRALSRAGDSKIKKLVNLNMWAFAGCTNLSDEIISQLSGITLSGRDVIFLQVLASSDHPAAKLVIARALPLIVETQNRDGSWGKEPVKDAVTLTVISALVSLGKALPPGFNI